MGDGIGIEAKSSARKRPRAIGRSVVAHGPVIEPLDVAQQRPGVGEEVVSDQHGLGVLKVCASGHVVRTGFFGAQNEDANHLDQHVPDAVSLIAQIHPHKRRDLIVAAASSAHRSPGFRPHAGNKLPL